MSRKRKSGHYCWSCNRTRANEKFSGSGHAQHLCKDCARLGNKELAYRQAVRDMDRLVTWEGIIPRKRREQFEKYLHHENERVRAYALELEMADAWARAERRLYRDLEDFLGELAAEGNLVRAEMGLPCEYDSADGREIPF